MERGTKPHIDPPTNSSAAQTQALWTMHTLGTLDSKPLLEALNSPDGAVRAQAVRLAETLPDDGKIVDRLCGLVADPDLRVRFQLALTLGEISDPRVPDILRSLAKRDGDKQDMLMALLSSVPRHAAALERAAHGLPFSSAVP